MSQLATAVLAALAALGLKESDHFASAVRGDVVTVVTTAGQKLVYDPAPPPKAPEGAAATEEGAGASAPAPTEVAPNTHPAEGQVEGAVSAAVGEASASPAASAAAPEAKPVDAKAKKPAPAGGKGKAKNGGAQ